MMRLACAKTAFFVVLLAGRGAWATHDCPELSNADLEDTQLRNTEEVTRDGEMLRLQTQNGLVTFENRQGGEGTANYYLVGVSHAPSDYFFLVRVFGWEGSGYRLVSATTGQTIHLNGAPVFSPDGRRFVETSLDIDAGYDPNLIRVHRLSEDRYEIEWTHSYRGRRGPANPMWLDDGTILFLEVTVVEGSSQEELEKTPFVVEWEDSEWLAPRQLR